MGHGTFHIVSHRGVHTVSHNSIPGAGLGVDLLLLWEGQSNAVGQADYNSTGGSDGSYNHATPFAAGLMNMYYGTSPTNFPIGPQTWIDTGLLTLQPYAAAGTSNQGPWLQCAKYLVKYGGYSKVGIIEVAISGSSLRRARGVGSGFPTTPPIIYDQMIARVAQMEALFGRKVDAICTMEGETDAGDATDTSTYQTNMGNYISTFRTTLNNPTCAYFVGQLNAATTFGPNQAGIRAAQAAYVATDSQSRLLNFDHIALHPDPHYDSCGQNDIGDLFGQAIITYLKPGFSTNLGSGPIPWYQQAASGITAVVSPSVSIPRSGPDPQDGDWEYMVAASYSAATTITLTTAAGFTPVTSNTSTFSGTIIRQMQIYERPVTAAILAANNGRMPNPVIDFGAADKNVARIFGVRGPNKWVTSPTVVSTVGANNSNNTSLTIAGGTTGAVTNCLALIFVLQASSLTPLQVTTITPSTFTGLVKHWDGRYNPGNGGVGVAFATAQFAAGGAFGGVSATFANAGINVGAIVMVKP